MRRFAITFLLICGFLAEASAADRAQPLVRGTTVRLATVEEGRTLITRRDTFTRNLSRFDLQCRLGKDEGASLDELLELYAENVTPWPDADAQAVLEAAAFVGDRLKGLTLSLPETVYIVRTTGKEEAGAAYCRGEAIILPENLLRQPADGLRRLVAHELFHVLSSHNPELRADLYKLVGFTVCEPIAPPPALADRIITNPDAPRIDCTINLTLADGTKATAAPLLVASSDYDPSAGKTLFQYLQFRLMVVERRDDRWEPVLVEGDPRLLDPRGIDSFHEQIGRNTRYIIHPDEILAENFAHLVMRTDRLPNPEIVEKIRERLSRSER